MSLQLGFPILDARILMALHLAQAWATPKHRNCALLAKAPTSIYAGAQLDTRYKLNHAPCVMQPNFEDFSCDMVFGQAAPAISEDEVQQQPCFAECPQGRQQAGRRCHKLA